MKGSYRYAVCLFAAVSLISCVNEPFETSNQVIESFLGKEVTLVADLDCSSQTKSEFNAGDGKIYWNPDDELSLFYGSGAEGGNKFTSTNDDYSNIANFTGTINVITAGGEDVTEDDTYFWGVYPYRPETSCDGKSVTTILPEVQPAKAGSFADDLYITMGRSSGLRMGFRSLCSALEFTVANEGIKKIVFSGNNGEFIAGTVKAGFDSNGIPEILEYIDGKTEITLNAPEGHTLVPGVTYYIVTLPVSFTKSMKMTFYKEDGSVAVRKWKTQDISMKRNIFKKYDNIDGSVVFSEAVDLGLSVKWATFNVGAGSAADYGDYFAWGETRTKESFTQEGYVQPAMAQLDVEHDAANANWNGDWRMPSSTEWLELEQNCKWEKTTDYQGSGIGGYVVTSKIEGFKDKSIFLPNVGLSYDGAEELRGTAGYYWSSVVENDFPHCYQIWSTETYLCSEDPAYCGMAVRPVCPVELEKLVSYDNEKTLYKRNTELIHIELEPFNATDRNIEWISMDESVVTIQSVDTKNLIATIHAEGVGTATVKAIASNGMSVSWTIHVLPEMARLPGASDGLWEYLLWEYLYPEFGYQAVSDFKSDVKTITFAPATDSSNDPQAVVVVNQEYVDDLECTPIYAFLDDDGNLTFTTTADTFEVTDCTGLFKDFTIMTSVTGLEYLDLINLDEEYGMYEMFSGCSKLANIDLSAWTVSSDIPVGKMFYNCRGLHELTFGPGFDFTGRTLGEGIFTNLGNIGGLALRWATFTCSYDQWQLILDLLDTTAGYTYYAAPSSIVVNGDVHQLKFGATTTLTCTVLPDDIADKSVTWSSSNEIVASVSQDGVVEGKSCGSATISATSNVGGAVGTYDITVYFPAYYVSISGQGRVAVGSSITLTAATKPVTSPSSVTWTSLNPSIATVSDQGVVTGVSNGEAFIRATSVDTPNVYNVKKVTVYTPVNSMSISGPESVFVGNTVSLTANVNPSTTSETISWSSSNTAVATVTPNGVVTGISPGTATITATSSLTGTKATHEISSLRLYLTTLNSNGERVEVPEIYYPLLSKYMHYKDKKTYFYVYCDNGTTMREYSIPGVSNSNITDHISVQLSGPGLSCSTGVYGGAYPSPMVTMTLATASGINRNMTVIVTDADYNPILQQTFQVNTTRGSAPVSASARRPGNECTWVQLWENGPKFAEFNVGATITDYNDPVDENSYTLAQKENRGGLYPYKYTGREVYTDSYSGCMEEWNHIGTMRPLDDVSKYYWGDNWRDPKDEEMNELLNQHLGIETVGNFIKCVKVTGQGNYGGSVLYLPFTGYYVRGESGIRDVNKGAYYWLYEFDNSESYLTYVKCYNVDNNNTVHMTSVFFNNGLPVRAVLDE